MRVQHEVRNGRSIDQLCPQFVGKTTRLRHAGRHQRVAQVFGVVERNSDSSASQELLHPRHDTAWCDAHRTCLRHHETVVEQQVHGRQRNVDLAIADGARDGVGLGVLVAHDSKPAHIVGVVVPRERHKRRILWTHRGDLRHRESGASGLAHQRQQVASDRAAEMNGGREFGTDPRRGGERTCAAEAFENDSVGFQEVGDLRDGESSGFRNAPLSVLPLFLAEQVYEQGTGVPRRREVDHVEELPERRLRSSGAVGVGLGCNRDERELPRRGFGDPRRTCAARCGPSGGQMEFGVVERPVVVFRVIAEGDGHEFEIVSFD